jgi:hypothetical protein
MIQKNKIIAIVVMLLCNTVSWAQTDETANEVMQIVNEALTQGDCDKAQRAYNTWKALTNTTDSSVEKKMKECKNEELPLSKKRSAPITYTITSEIKKEYRKLSIGQQYTSPNGCSGKIAYLDATGQHGLLLTTLYNGEKGTYYYGNTYEVCRRYATKGELELIYENSHLLGLKDEYWSSTRAKKIANWEFYYTVDFSSGKSKSRDSYKVFYFLYVTVF